MRSDFCQRCVTGICVLGGLLAAPPAPGQSADWCGSSLTADEAELVRALEASGAYAPPERPLVNTYVPVTFHVVRRSNGSGGLSEAHLVGNLDRANLGFANAGIRFCWPGPIDYIDSDDFYFNIDTQAEIDALRRTRVVPGTINIYFTQNLANEGGRLCGISSFTWSSVQGIVVANGCADSPAEYAVLVHELGHYFDLLHTHETALGWECPACDDETFGGRMCNCNLAGDLLCDTPADPMLDSNNVDANCRYVGTSRDPCTNSPYTPDPRNLMSYAPVACQNLFTAQQLFRMQATLTRLRPELMDFHCPGDNQWNVSGKLLAGDGAAGDYFGTSVSLSGDTALVGAFSDDDRGTNSGSAYVFRDLNALRTPCPGDLDGDRDVDLADLAVLLSCYGRNESCGDTDGDGDTDLADLALLLSVFRQPCP